MSSVWDDPQKVEKLKRLWAEGLSASEIAGRILGDSTQRSAVIGKAHRLNLADRSNHRRSSMARRPASQRPNFQFARRPCAANAAGHAAPSISPEGGPLHSSQPKFIVRKPRCSDRTRPSDKAQFFDFHFGNTPKPLDGVVDPAPDASDPAPDQRVSFVDLERRHCRWPISGMYCGRPHADGSPYCDAHSQRAFNGWRPRKISQLPDSLRGEPGHPTEKESADADGKLVRGNAGHEGGKISAPPAINQ